MNKKKMIALLSGLFMLLFTALNASAAVNVTVPYMGSDEGMSVNVPVNVDDATGIAGFQLTIQYNPAVLMCTYGNQGDLQTSAGQTWVVAPGMGTASCGDGVVNGLEECDDNNNLDGDGCSADCTIESGTKNYAGYNPTLTGLSGGSGSILKINCNVLGSLGDSTDICITAKKLVDGSGIEIASSLSGDGCSVFCIVDFNDVPPGFWAENYINSIYCGGITTGCTLDPLNYCPFSNVTRQAMAAFIIRAVEGEPPSDYCNTGSPFIDVPTTSQFCKYIKRLYELGITTGCTPTEYCPLNPVTRQAMAAFIIRALFGETFDYTPSPFFTDVPDAGQFFKYIQKMKDEGITTGCTATEYCPLNNVTRAAMAAFLARAFLGMP